MPATAGTFGGGALLRRRALSMKVPAFAGMTLFGAVFSSPTPVMPAKEPVKQLP
jgi:hypothetical protein